jgi:hypothetical protein
MKNFKVKRKCKSPRLAPYMGQDGTNKGAKWGFSSITKGTFGL